MNKITVTVGNEKPDWEVGDCFISDGFKARMIIKDHRNLYGFLNSGATTKSDVWHSSIKSLMEKVDEPVKISIEDFLKEAKERLEYWKRRIREYAE